MGEQDVVIGPMSALLAVTDGGTAYQAEVLSTLGATGTV